MKEQISDQVNTLHDAPFADEKTATVGDAKEAFTPAPQLPARPKDRYVLEYWTVLSTSIAKSVATYYENATAAEVWPGDEFNKRAPPFIDQWLVEGWEHGRVTGWLNIIPAHRESCVYWTEADALNKLIFELERRARHAREEVKEVEACIADARAALALATTNDLS